MACVRPRHRIALSSRLNPTSFLQCSPFVHSHTPWSNLNGPWPLAQLVRGGGGRCLERERLDMVPRLSLIHI
eukprot:350487-Rhodomonas_salina.1